MSQISLSSRLIGGARPARVVVPVYRLGTEINSDLAQHIRSVCHHDFLHNRDPVVYYHHDTMSFRYGRVRLPVRDTIEVGPQTKSVLVEVSEAGEIQSFDLIDVFVYEDDAAPKQWIQGQVLGQGAFGLVFEAIDVVNGTRLAVKQVPIAHENGPGALANDKKIMKLCNEVHFLKSFSHANIVRYIGARLHVHQQCLHIFMELVSTGSLSQLLRNYGPLPESLIYNYTRQIVLGLQYLHDNNVVHRDIKSSNILITGDGVIKLADFGAARQLQDACLMPSNHHQTVCGTPGWMAPEVVRHGRWSLCSDIWSLGCVLIEMATGSRPWPQHTPNQLLWILAETDQTPAIPAHLSEQAQSLIRMCLQRDAERRPPTKQLLQHPFLEQDIDSSTI